jgi:hypothetical protein
MERIVEVVRRERDLINHNRSLERSEIEALGPEALIKDWNSDEVVTAQEAWGDVASPNITYHVRRQIELGGKRVELIHPGDGLGTDVTLVLFPDERILFAARLPERLAANRTPAVRHADVRERRPAFRRRSSSAHANMSRR